MLSQDKKLLLVTEKWCDGDPARFESNTLHNVHGSLETSGIAYESIFYDELWRNGVNVNTVLDQLDPANYHACIILPMYGMPFNPSEGCVKAMKTRGFKIGYIWPDAAGAWTQQQISTLGDYTDLHILWDTNLVATKHNDKCVFTWTPQDFRIYNDPGLERNIDVCFVGSKVRHDRAPMLHHLQSLGIKIYITGGQREEYVTPKEYARILQQSKISINFSMCSGSTAHQFKGRTIESTACGALLLESENPFTKTFFEEGKEFCSFKSIPEAADIIKHMLANPAELSKIAKAGHEKAMKSYNGTEYWSKVLRALNVQK